MPTYNTQCIACGDNGDLRLSFSDYEAIRGGSKTLVCNSCGGACAIQFDASTVQFILKDGESGGWQSKAMKENRYRAQRRQVMARRERDHVFKPRLQPNYKGLETGSWKDAREVARSEVSADHGKSVGDLVAKTYNPLVTKASTE